MPEPVDFGLLGLRENATLEIIAAAFEDGSFALLKLCTGTRFFYGDSVLFSKDGAETGFPVSFFDIGIGDELEFESEDARYVVRVKEIQD